MSRSLDRAWPEWLRDVNSLLAVHPHYTLSGNVNDWYRLPGDDPRRQLVDSVASALLAGLETVGFDAILVHDVVDGYSVVSAGTPEDAWSAVQTVVGRDLRAAAGSDLALLSEVIRALGRNTGRRLALVLEHASLIVSRRDEPEPAERDLFRVASKVARTALRIVVEGSDRVVFNPVLWLVPREHDLPAWYAAGNTGVRVVPIPYPDLGDRADVAELLLAQVPEDRRRDAGDALAAGTDGLGASSLFAVTRLMADQQLPEEEPEDAVRTYRIGAAESPWRQGEVAERLRGGDGRPDAHAALSAKVLGQDRAVTKSVDILIRAVMGLSGAQVARSSSRPRGVLFFVGPTGTGKTELAKSITELVFGTSDAYTRFDMSEFAAEHAGDRLIGAPPGYVGFDAGGELTNAVRQRPHSLLLFDEIEKAHPLILDKFLQILEDGRLTDGRGITVHFSETLIVFTSNIGFYRLSEDGRTRVPNLTPGEPFEVLEQKVRRSVHDYFASELNRPEILNRIGDNVVVFDFIGPDAGRRIADLQIANVLARVMETSEIEVSMASEATEQLRSLATADLSFGGRGIGNIIESRFVNPLARALFLTGAKPGDRRTVTAITEGSTGPEVQLR